MERESRNARTLHEGRRFSYDRVSAYRQRFIDPETGRFHAHLVRDRDCPVCASANHVPVFDKDGGTTAVCLDCTMVFVNPCFTDEALAAYYRDLDTGQAEITATESDFYREIYGRGLDLIGRHRPAPGKILDIGCSSGFFLDLARDRGWQTAGIELGVAEAELARRKQHDVHTRPIEEVAFPARFDAIALWDVFEHVPDGARLWQRIDANLAPGGIVFLQIPNADSLAARIMRAASRMHDCLEHVNLYNPATIRRFAASVGYDVVDITSVISEVSVLNNYLHYEDPYFGSSRWGQSLLGVIDEQAIHANLLGYKLQIALARR